MGAKRVDANQPEIVRMLRAVGATVQVLSDVGSGCPDLLVGLRGENHLLEVKVGRAKLTGDELQWHLEWRGAVVVVRTAEEALRAIGVIGEKREIQEGRVFKAHDRKAAVVGEKGEA